MDNKKLENKTSPYNAFLKGSSLRIYANPKNFAMGLTEQLDKNRHINYSVNLGTNDNPEIAQKFKTFRGFFESRYDSPKFEGHTTFDKDRSIMDVASYSFGSDIHKIVYNKNHPVSEGWQKSVHKTNPTQKVQALHNVIFNQTVKTPPRPDEVGKLDKTTTTKQQAKKAFHDMSFQEQLGEWAKRYTGIGNAMIHEHDFNLDEGVTFHGKDQTLSIDKKHLEGITPFVSATNAGALAGVDKNVSQGMGTIKAFFPDKNKNESDSISTHAGKVLESKIVDHVNQALGTNIKHNPQEAGSNVQFNYRGVEFKGRTDVLNANLEIKTTGSQNKPGFVANQGYEPHKLQSAIYAYGKNPDAEHHTHVVATTFLGEGNKLTPEHTNVDKTNTKIFRYNETKAEIEQKLNKVVAPIHNFQSTGKTKSLKTQEALSLADKFNKDWRRRQT